MAKNATSKARIAYVCTECGAEYSKWQGQCTECGTWNGLSQITPGNTASP
ncbi:MAG TPA: DNA repair protein RadA, partial [Xylella sp.]